MSVNIGGVVSVAVFYLLILAVGVWCGWRQNTARPTSSDGPSATRPTLQ